MIEIWANRRASKRAIDREIEIDEQSVIGIAEIINPKEYPFQMRDMWLNHNDEPPHFWIVFFLILLIWIYHDLKVIAQNCSAYDFFQCYSMEILGVGAYLLFVNMRRYIWLIVGIIDRNLNAFRSKKFHRDFYKLRQFWWYSSFISLWKWYTTDVLIKMNEWMMPIDTLQYHSTHIASIKQKLQQFQACCIDKENYNNRNL